jgi:hypothetical protein
MRDNLDVTFNRNCKYQRSLKGVSLLPLTEAVTRWDIFKVATPHDHVFPCATVIDWAQSIRKTTRR